MRKKDFFPGEDFAESKAGRDWRFPLMSAFIESAHEKEEVSFLPHPISDSLEKKLHYDTAEHRHD